MRFVERVKNGVKRRVKRLFHKKDQGFNQLHAHLMSDQDTVRIFDVGAHRGESIKRFQGVFPMAEIHSFEPDIDNFANLKETATEHKNVNLNNFALGAKKETRTFHRNAKSDTSSFLAVNKNSNWLKTRSNQYAVSANEFMQKSYEVEIKTLDSYMAENNIDRISILKIDTQGFEDQVLQGAAKALADNAIDVIETELICSGLYEKSLSFYEIEQYLLPYGYRLCAIDRSADMLSSADALCFNLIYARAELLGQTNDQAEDSQKKVA